MKLYVWEEVLVDYTPGLVVVLAHDDAEARQTLRSKDGLYGHRLGDGLKVDGQEPKIYEARRRRAPVVHWVSGGS